MLTIPTLTPDQFTALDWETFDQSLMGDQTLWQQWISEGKVRLTWALVINPDHRDA